VCELSVVDEARATLTHSTVRMVCIVLPSEVQKVLECKVALCGRWVCHDRDSSARGQDDIGLCAQGK
jgi:hypothetical protein